MKFRIVILVCFGCFALNAQQTARYNQYLLNNYMINPAYAGTHNNWEFLMGRHSQWLGFDYAPATTFFSATYTIRPNFSYKGWHGLGGYIEQDKRGVFTGKSVYLSYSYHFRISKGYNLGFGMFVGGKSLSVSNSIAYSDDPALIIPRKAIYYYPDFIPGFRLYSKKMFMGISVRQLYKNNLKQGSKEIGTDSKLIPTISFNYGRKFRSAGNDFIFTPSTNVLYSVTGKPLMDLAFNASYHNRIGVGAIYNVNNSVTATMQVHITKKIVFGIAYNYATNGLRNAYANSLEAMFGFTPAGADDQPVNRNRVARCPEFDF
jgi:type IX secretion system PorP/SprF family membrane protein